MRWLASLLLGFLVTLPASGQIVRVKVDNTIQPISEEYIVRAIDHAAQQQSKAVLIELYTPGGLLQSTRVIVSKILSSPVPVIVYVAPSGARAASAGFFILEAADVAAMAPGTNTGAAHPVPALGGKPDETMKAKIENDTMAYLRSYVSKRGRNVAVAETAVRDSKSWTDQEALAQNLIDIVAPSEQELFRQLEGRTIRRFDGSTAVLRVANQPVVNFEMTLRQKILDFFMDPTIAFVVLIGGLFALYFEFNHPGAILPGVLGVIAILLVAFSFHLLPIRYAALAMILLSIALFILEANFASHGILGASGVALLTLGALLLVDAPIPEMRIRLVAALGVSIPFGIITVFLTTIAIKARRNKATTGSQGMVGQTGVARSALDPAGMIAIGGELWRATSEVPIAPGESVVVRAVDGLQLRVEPAPAITKSEVKEG